MQSIPLKIAPPIKGIAAAPPVDIAAIVRPTAPTAEDATLFKVEPVFFS